MNATPQLILLPGLGADQRLLEPQRWEFPDLLVPPWIPPRPKELLSDYAARMAAAVAPVAGRPLVLGGVSFGGMAAYEMAKHLKPDAVVLIASCRTRRGLRVVYRLARGLWPMLPVSVWSIAKWFSPPVARFTSRTAPDQRQLLIRMFKEMDPGFMHWVVQAILCWEPTPMDGTAVFHIHGRHDLMIPARRVDADAWIPDGGHMINITHPREVNAFLRRVMDGGMR
jgi:pimeloyl-ACP methyl ester carboxylesterase